MVSVNVIDNVYGDIDAVAGKVEDEAIKSVSVREMFR